MPNWQAREAKMKTLKMHNSEMDSLIVDWNENKVTYEEYLKALKKLRRQYASIIKKAVA